MESSSPARRRGRPAQIDREKIVTAVMAAPDLNALTVRELAATLGVSHGALYRWVKNQDEIFDLVCDVIVERILPAAGVDQRGLQAWLADLARAMHREFLAVPGFATRLSRPHRHSTRAFAPFREAVITAFVGAGLTPELAEQNWYVFIVPTVSWLASEESPLALGDQRPDYALFLEALLAGLPVGLASPTQA